MTETVIGGGTSTTLTQEEQYALARRKGIQAYVLANIENPDAIIGAMMTYGVGFAELNEAMNATHNMTHYLRRAGVADGFGGLKVWSDAEINKYLAYVEANYRTRGWGLPGVIDPVEAQDVLDWAERMRKARPSFVAPWTK